MNNFIRNGHVGGYDLGIAIIISSPPNSNVLVKNILPLFVWGYHTKTQTLKLIHMSVHKNIEQQRIIPKV